MRAAVVEAVGSPRKPAEVDDPVGEDGIVRNRQGATHAISSGWIGLAQNAAAPGRKLVISIGQRG